MNLQELINHNQNFSEFSETEAMNLKKLASFFQDLRKLLKTVCFDCEITLFWQNLLKGVCFGQNIFFLGIAGKNSRFCQNSLTYRDPVMVIFRFLGQNGLKLELHTFVVHKILMEHKKEDIK